MNVPVLLIIFNRPEKVRRLVDALRLAKPPLIYVAADGPREGHPDDVEKCRASREAIEQIDWECTVEHNYSDANLGCKYRPVTAIDWVLEAHEMLMVLEDDCIPSRSFFTFCEAMLDRYRDDDRIFTISGSNFHAGGVVTPHSYYFSRHFHCHGWATWRRAWKFFDAELTSYPQALDDGSFRSMFKLAEEYEFWKAIFDRIHDRRINDIWDYQMRYCFGIQHGLSIVPQVNLVSNIGWDREGVHCVAPTRWAGIELNELTVTSHPPFTVPNGAADDALYREMYAGWKPETVTPAKRALRAFRRRISRYARSSGDVAS